jgi:granule-bound starch synthase
MIAARNNAPGTLALTAPARASPCLQPFRVSSGHKTSGARANTSRRCGRVLPQAAASPVPTTVAPAGPSQAKTPLDIVFISSEVAPWSKTGGLGDVVGSLPVELAKRGHNVFSIAPRFDQYADAWDTSVMIEVDGEEVRFFHTVKQGVHRVWIDHPWFLAKVG